MLYLLARADTDASTLLFSGLWKGVSQSRGGVGERVSRGVKMSKYSSLKPASHPPTRDRSIEILTLVFPNAFVRHIQYLAVTRDYALLSNFGQIKGATGERTSQ